MKRSENRYQTQSLNSEAVIKGFDKAPSGQPEEMKEYPLVPYTEEEELANRLTHGFGAVLSMIGMVFLIVQAALCEEVWRIVSCGVYGTILFLFYCLSTLYHSVKSPRIRYLFRILDHAGIYLLIAGTYTPFALVSLRGAWGWSLFGVIWGLALVGVIFKIFMVGRWPILSPILYIAMGWLIVVALEPLSAALHPWGIRWLFAGGCAYTLGVIFYAWERIPFNHAIWHLFVLAGSVCHFLAIFLYVLPMN